MKKIVLGILAVTIIGGVSFMMKAVFLDRPADPQAFVNQAVANYFETESAAFESSVNLSISGAENLAGNLVLSFSGRGNELKKYLPNLDYNLAVTGTAGGATIDLAGELLILDEVFYGKLARANLTGAPNEIAAAVGAAGAFAEKWFAISFAKLKSADPEIEKLFEEQKNKQLALRTELKNLFATNDIFLVKSLPFSFGQNQKFKVELNSEFLASNQFFTIIEKMLTPQLSEGTESPFALTEEIKNLIKKVLLTIAKNSSGTLEIGKKNGLIQRETVVLNLNLTDLSLESLPDGQITIYADTKISGIGKPQEIFAPTEFEEIDPLTLIPAPAEVATELETEENLE
ncbi:hypothetical protein K9N08_00600 [Candidatus Gracilibacteria bacterium]|nr:hypothetical protein [Candidatus Gracilibacteria bacterium]MCF7856042.1 hypothetical protein [Candidatus Gracilibacteria bacterium]MCF7896403.1 hypothetical protein [Candidatus Gracilibacteria bacterium]